MNPNPRKWIVRVLVAIIVWGVAHILWNLHPWMLRNTTVFLGRWVFSGHEVQIWQRKNEDDLEPFSTGFFVRRTNSNWKAYCIDHQDVFRPKIKCQATKDEILVLEGKTMLARFSLRDD